MSLISELESFLGLGATAAEVVTNLNTEEKVVITGLTGVSALITAGATVESAVASELETLLPNLRTAIADVDAKVEGAAAKLKTAVTSAQAWLAARTIVATSAEAREAEHVAASAFHIS